MWGSSEEPPGTMEAGPPEPVASLKETYEHNKNQLESVKDIMLRNKESIKKKEEELEEYTKKLSKFKNRSKRSRSKKDDGASCSESTSKIKSNISISEYSGDVVDDISQAKTPKAKSSLLQKKLAEDRKIFEQRSKELTENKRAVEEKVEAIRQQLEEKYVAPVSVANPAAITSQITHSVVEPSHVQDKDNKIAELSNKIYELESVIIDLQENLKEKDLVIDSKTKAVTLMSADLSKKGKTTLDTLEDTKDEMRSMQKNFIIVETSLRNKNDNLLKQLEEKTSQISSLEDNIGSLMEKLEAQKQAETVSADFSRSTMDTLADTKDEMKSMQENFILIETSLKEKNNLLLKQLEEREIKLAEAEARVLNLETGIGIQKRPDIENLLYRVEKLEKVNHDLQDEKYELQKSIAELQDKIIFNTSSVDNDLLNEKDNRISDLESQIDELKKNNQTLEEEYKLKLSKQMSELNERNEQLSHNMMECEKQIQDLENERTRLTSILNEKEIPKEDERVQQLTKELEELNKGMIKLKAQHKNKLKNMQKQLENFKKVSDTNAELVKLGNQVTLLEEEKGNLQLSLVDFDELKVLAGDWQQRISDLEGKVSAQVKEIQTHIQAIAILENQKLDLIQELHTVKQEVSSLEAENAESENLRVTAEMKVVDLEEELDSLQKHRTEPPTDSELSEYERQIENLTQENERLSQKISKFEELKSLSEIGSTESFVKTGSNVDSTESFEALSADSDKSDLLKKIDFLTRENAVLSEKLSRFEEKGSSDSGSTESFERIPEHGESTSRLENLTRENYELVVKLTKLEEKLATESVDNRMQLLNEENKRLTAEITQLQKKLTQIKEEGRLKKSLELLEEVVSQTEVHSTIIPEEKTINDNVDKLMAKIENLTTQNEKYSSSLEDLDHSKQELKLEKEAIEQEKQNLEKDRQQFEKRKYELEQGQQELLANPAEKEEVTIQHSLQVQKEQIITPDQENLQHASQKIKERTEESENKSIDIYTTTIASLESEIERCNALILEQNSFIEEMKIKFADKEEELERKSIEIAKNNEMAESDIRSLRRELEENTSAIFEWTLKCSEMENKMSVLEQDKQRIEEGLQALQGENKHLIGQCEHKDSLIISLREELESTIRGFEEKLRDQRNIISSEEHLVDEFTRTIEEKDIEIQEKSAQLLNDTMKINELQEELENSVTRVQQRDATIASFTKQIEDLRVNVSIIEEDLFSARHQTTVLEEKLKNSKGVEEYYQIMDRLNEKEMLVEELEVKLAQKTSEAKSLKIQVESLAAENENIRLQLQDEERKIADLLEANESQEEALKNSERVKAEVENRLMDLQITHEESVRHAQNISSELQDAYKMLEQLKLKHTEDTDMLNRRLMDIMEELQGKTHDLENLQSELEEVKGVASMCVPQDVKLSLEAHIVELEQKLADSEEKTQAQLDKMKKYVAVAKKKAAQVEELEVKLNDLEQQLSFERNEKEIRSDKLQESISHAKEKDNRIVDLEENIRRLQLERDEALQSVTAVEVELNETKNKLTAINKELLSLADAKDDARELGVRMHVMETEYVEQLAQINSLKAENGFLLSKQTQINERLETVEKESEERRAQLEKFEKEREIAETEKSEKCGETCGQCITRVLALEAKLQERDAEIENLDNELHNSIGNLVQMQENLRLSTISAVTPDTSLQDAYHELTMQYNTLTASYEDMNAKYETVLRDNEELRGQLNSLQEANVILQDRAQNLEKHLTQARVSVASLEILSSNYEKHMEMLEKEKLELQEMRAREDQNVIPSGTTKISKSKVASDNGQDLEDKLQIIDALSQQIEQVPVNEIMEKQKREVQADELSLPFFDASVFNVPQPLFNNAEPYMEIIKLKDEVSLLNTRLNDERSIAQQIQTRLSSEIEQKREVIESLTQELRTLNESRKELETVIAGKDVEMQALHSNSNSANEALISIKAEFEQLNNVLKEKTARIEGIENEKSNYFTQLKELSLEKQNIEVAITELLSSLSIPNKFSTSVEKMEKLNTTIRDILKDLKDLRIQNQEILADKEILRNEATQEFSEDLTRLQGQLHIVTQERDQLIEDLKAFRNIQHQKQVEPVPSVPPETKEPISESMWEDDEDPWGLNDRESSHVVDEPYVNIPIIPSIEIQLKLRVNELEQKLQELTEENAKLVEDGKIAQVKNIKYVKKLKEYKIQFDSLQRELNSQKSIGSFGDLDSAIENELKDQIESLEKALMNTKEENRKLAVEKDNLMKRIDVLTAATERFTESKEKQDTEMHIWQKRYRDLELKLQQLDFGSEVKEASSSMSKETLEISKHDEEIKELKDNVEALAAENEELQQLLEANRTKKQTSMEETINQVQELQSLNENLITNNEKLKHDYESLRIKYDQSLINAENENAENEETVSGLNKRLLEVLNENSMLNENIIELKKELESSKCSHDSYDSLHEIIYLRDNEVTTLKNEVFTLKNEIEELKLSIASYLKEANEKDVEIQTLRESLHNQQALLADYEQQLTFHQTQFEQLTKEMQQYISQVQNQEELMEKFAERERRNNELEVFISEKDSSLTRSEEEVQKLQQELDRRQLELEEVKSKLEALVKKQEEQSTVNIKKEIQLAATKVVDDNIPVFTFGSDENDKQLNNLRAELKAKEDEIEHLRYTIDESSTTHMIQDLQDNVNSLYNEKSYLESELIAKNQEIGALKSQIIQLQAEQPIKRSLGEQEELLKLQNELHIRDQEMNELRLVIAEKESQLRATLEQSNHQDLAEELKAELYKKQQELEGLKFTVSELQSEVAALRGLERLAAEDKAIIERLSSEKEEVRVRAEQEVQRLLREKEGEIDHLKQQLVIEKQGLIGTLELKERDLDNLKLQIQQIGFERDTLLEENTQQLRRMESELSERDRRLAELNITKDTESHNLRMQLGEKTVRLEELIVLSEEEDKQLAEMRKLLEVKEQQMYGLTQQLEEKTKEYELTQHALRQHIRKTEEYTESQYRQESSGSTSPSDEVTTTNKLDLALNMLHHRDVRCEELTHELMQLLEERDTLQLRLSNAIAVNEELRKLASSSSTHKMDSLILQDNAEPHIADPSSSKSEGPVEIAKEAINLPVSEDKQALALKLSQLRNVDQARDLRLRDDREMRHMEQMSLLVHGDMLNSLPPEAAARLHNANYTLSRDVQSQSSVLMNWLWGKSTPKVVHM